MAEDKDKGSNFSGKGLRAYHNTEKEVPMQFQKKKQDSEKEE